MRWPLFIIILFIFSCTSRTENEKLHDELTGNWLILYPDHDLENYQQKVIYSKIQDSIVSLSGLKLISFSENGIFEQVDSIGKKGKWGMTADRIVFIEKGGKGFENFASRFMGYKDGVLQLAEVIEAEGEKIKLTWKLKKVTGGAVSELFNAENNEWRKRPDQPESEQQMKARLSAMLRYYSNYYKLVTKEASVFITSRVLLPFRFYQHAMGMKDFDEKSFFAGLFFNNEQAKRAHFYFKLMLNKLRNDYPRKKDYVAEYAEFMKRMADEMVKE